MSRQILGIHHVTAIAGDPQQNVDFYAGLLGLRLVKRTVNFDDPGTYHLYYGDGAGRPGTILTFFPWPGARRGLRGTGQVTVTSFSIPEGALGYWADRLKASGIVFRSPTQRFDSEVLSFSDPDGLELELVAHGSAEGREPWNDGPISPKYALRGFYGVTLAVEGYERTASLLSKTLGFAPVQQSGNRFRFRVGSGGSEAMVDVLCLPDVPFGWVAVGSVHHVAWRTANDDEENAWREELASLGFNVTPLIDRQYFHSVYFREPGGVLFELATDPPGFTTDEPLDQLGARLMLPPWLEVMRAQLEKALPALRVPAKKETPR